MKNINTMTQKLPKEDYIKLFKQSKICVACWGHGEWVHMDGYAMYAGVVLIKPNTNYVKMYPDLYQDGKKYVACRPDFSDLEDKIRDILNNYEQYKEMVLQNKEDIMKLNEKMCAELFWDKIKSIFILS